MAPLQPSVRPTLNKDQKFVDLKYLLDVRHYNEAVRDGKEAEYWNMVVPVLHDMWEIMYGGKNGVKGIWAGMFDSNPTELKPVWRWYLPTITEMEIPIKATDQPGIFSIPRLLYDIYGLNESQKALANVENFSSPLGPYSIIVDDKQRIRWHDEQPFESLHLGIHNKALEHLLGLRKLLDVDSITHKQVWLYHSQIPSQAPTPKPRRFANIKWTGP